MNVLLFQFFFIVVGGVIIYNSPIKKRQKDTLFVGVAFVVMWYIHSMVDPSSLPDLPIYKEVFESIGVTEWKHIPNHWAHINMELGYLYFNKLIYLVITSFTVFLWIFSFLMLSFYVYTIKNYSPYIVLSVLLLLLIPYNQSLFVIRQHMAVAIYFSTIPLILNRKLIPFLFVAVVAFFIHRSSIVFVPIYFLLAFDGKRLVYALFTSIIVIYLLWQMVLSFSVLSFDYEWFAEKSERSTNLTTLIQSVLLYIFYIYTLRKEIFVNKINKLMFCILSLSVFTNFMSLGFNMGRITIYFNVFNILAIPITLTYIKTKFIRNVIGASIILLFFIQMMYGGNHQYVESMQLLSLF